MVATMIRIGMSTSCVYPLGTESSFRLSHEAGYDGVEVMVTAERTTQRASLLLALAERYEQPVMSIHAPVLFLTQWMWGDARGKLQRSVELAEGVGAGSVVVHPPFVWQYRYARQFEDLVREISGASGIELCVENMFSWKVGRTALKAYAPSIDPTAMDVDAMTLDFSHASLSGRDSLELAMAMGDRLRHVHLCDGSRSVLQGQTSDQHMIPGRGTQPVAEVLSYLASTGWDGQIVAEVHTSARSAGGRLGQLRETLAFARAALAPPLDRTPPLDPTPPLDLTRSEEPA
jgi:sugar phosphate isomerase/epimerase